MATTYVDACDNDFTSSYAGTLTKNDDSNLTVNLRLESFDSSMAMVTDASYAVDSLVTAMDFSATAVIFVKTADIRSTFQFAVDSDHLTDVGSAAFDAGVRFYVFDKNDISLVDASLADIVEPPTWRWNVDASASDASYIIQPAHGMMDVSSATLSGHNSSHEVAFSQANIVEGSNNDGNLREDRLVKQDFVRHISKSVLGNADLAGLFNNVDELMLELENGGVSAWDSIRSNLKTAHDANPQTQFQINKQTNPTRELYRQLFKRNPDRFRTDVSNGIADANGNPQPLPFKDGDILEFKFVVDCSAISIPDPTVDPNGNHKKKVDTRTYRIKMCLVDGSGNTNQFNTTPPNYVYDYGVNVTDVSANNADGKVEALAKHQKYYILDKAGSGGSGGGGSGSGSGGGSGGSEIIPGDVGSWSDNTAYVKVNWDGYRAIWQIETENGTGLDNTNSAFKLINGTSTTTGMTSFWGSNMSDINQVEVVDLNDNSITTTIDISSAEIQYSSFKNGIKLVWGSSGQTTVHPQTINDKNPALSGNSFAFRFVNYSGSSSSGSLTSGTPSNGDGSELSKDGKSGDFLLSEGQITTHVWQSTGTHNLRLPISAQLFTDDQLTKKFKTYATLDSDEQTVELTNLTYAGTDNGVSAAPGRYYGCDISPASPPDLVSDSGSQIGFTAWAVGTDTFKLYYNLN